MNRNELSNVTLATIENYRVAATRATQAYRSGGVRLVDTVLEGIEKQLDERAERLVPRATKRIAQWRRRLGQMVTGGIDAVARGTEQAVDAGTAYAARGVKRVHAMTAAVETPVLAMPLEAAARIALPGAQAALALSERVAKGTQKAGRAATGKRTKAKADTAVHAAEAKVRRARRQVKAVADEVAKTVRTAAKAPRKAAAPRARKAAKAVEAAAE